MKEAYASIIKSIGEDLNRPGLTGTPERAAKAMEFLTQGYRQNVDTIINDAMFEIPSEKVSEKLIINRSYAEEKFSKSHYSKLKVA